MKNRKIKELGYCILLGLVFSTSSVSADTCKNVDFSVQNNRLVTIKALKMEYKFQEDGVWRTKDFANEDVASGHYEVVANNVNLQGGEGNHMYALKLHYKAWCGGQWTGKRIGVMDTAFDNTSICDSNSGRVYRYDTSSSDICNNL